MAMKSTQLLIAGLAGVSLAACGMLQSENEPAPRASAGASKPSFGNLDANDDGQLTLAEAAVDTRISRSFKSADRDNDNRLDRDEFQAALEIQGWSK